MGSSKSYQVEVGAFTDIAQPFLAGSKTLSNTLQDTIDNKLNQDKLKQIKLEHADAMRQEELDRKERANARRAASGRGGRARVDAAAQLASIQSALTSFNTPGGINTGLETQNNINSYTEGLVGNYNQISSMLSNQKDNNQGILDAIYSKGDAMVYDNDGKVLPNLLQQKTAKTQFDLEEKQKQVDDVYGSLINTLDNDLMTSAYKSTNDLMVDPIQPNKEDIYAPEKDLLGSLATQGNEQLDLQQTDLNNRFDTKIGSLNDVLT